MRPLKLATVFSGVGAVEQALLKMKQEYEIVFACDTGERYLTHDKKEITNSIEGLSYNDKKKYIRNLYDLTKKDNYVRKSYFLNYAIEEEQWYEDIRFIDGKLYTGKVDLFVGGSPCQSFSVMGKRGGLEDARGTLFYEYARLIKEIQPKVFIFENVPGIISHDEGRTWKTIETIFKSLNYSVQFRTLNSKDYGVPQDRKRFFAVGFKDMNARFTFPEKMPLIKTAKDYLEESNIVKPNHYLTQKGFEFVTNPKYKSRGRIMGDIIRTQKANQQFNWNGDFVFVEKNEINNADIIKRAYLGLVDGKEGYIRQLTHKECFRLMGFNDDFIIDVPNVQAYRQSGNSIVVNVLIEIIKEILKGIDFNE